MQISLHKLEIKYTVQSIGMFKSNSDVCFVLIPKNAHLSMQYTLENEGFKRKNITGIEKSKHYVTMIRNPVGRWITGFATFLVNQVNNSKLLEKEAYALFENQDILDYIFNKLEFDIHTTKQTKILERFDEIKFFTLEKGQQNLIKWMNENGVLLTGIDTAHMTKNFDKEGFHYKIYQHIKNFISDKKYIDILETYYKEDLKLWRSCNGD